MSSFDDLGWRWYWHIHVLHSGLDLSFWFTSEHQAWRGLLKWNWLQQTCEGALHSIGIQNQWDASHTSTFPTMWEPFLDDSSFGSNTLWGILFKVGITGNKNQSHWSTMAGVKFIISAWCLAACRIVWEPWTTKEATGWDHPSGQIITLHQPKFPGKRGISLHQLTFGVRSPQRSL